VWPRVKVEATVKTFDGKKIFDNKIQHFFFFFLVFLSEFLIKN
jgi:hypothetical protein